MAVVLKRENRQRRERVRVAGRRGAGPGRHVGQEIPGTIELRLIQESQTVLDGHVDFGGAEVERRGRARIDDRNRGARALGAHRQRGGEGVRGAVGAAPLDVDQSATVPVVDVPLPQSRVKAVPLAWSVLPQTTMDVPNNAWRVGMIRVSALALAAAIATTAAAIRTSRPTLWGSRILKLLMFVSSDGARRRFAPVRQQPVRFLVSRMLVAIRTPSTLQELPMFLGIRRDETRVRETEVGFSATKADLAVALCALSEH